MAFAVPKGFEDLSESIQPFVQNENEDSVVALVNDRKVLFQDIQFRFFNMLRAHASVHPETPLNKDIVLNYRKKAAEHQITKQVLTIEIERLNFNPTEAQLEERLQQIRNAFSAQADFDQKLKEQNADLVLLKEETRFQMAVDNLLGSFDKEVTQLSEEEVQKYYVANPSLFIILRKIRFSLITIFSDADLKREAINKNLGMIRKIRSDILARKNTFEFYAKNFSDDEGTRKNSGDVGFFLEKDIKEPFVPIKDLWIGELSPVYSYAKGFYIAKVTEEIPESKIIFSEIQNTLRTQLYNQAIQTNRNKRITEIRNPMKIELL
jgi:hypothetical protein